MARLMQLDAMGERLSGVEGEVGYLALPDRSCHYTAPFPLEMLVTGAEKYAIDALVAERPEALRETGLRPGADPVHAPLNESPARPAISMVCMRAPQGICPPVPSPQRTMHAGCRWLARHVACALPSVTGCEVCCAPWVLCR